MMRSLWTAATGMTSQQTAVDVIANNLANVNTIGYKAQSAQFKTLLYQTSQSLTTSSNGDPKPVSAQVGLGVRNSAIAMMFTQGSLQETGISTDFGIDGKGFFQVMDLDDQVLYTRNGSFVWTPMGDDTMMLCNGEGYGVLDTNGEKIVVDQTEYDMSLVNIDASGNLVYPDENNRMAMMGVQIGLVQFNNPGGLVKASDSNYMESAASGQPVSEADGMVGQTSKLRQNYVEMSNVNVATEMVNLIVAQRAYEMNSKAITTSDDMLQQANQLKR